VLGTAADVAPGPIGGVLGAAAGAVDSVRGAVANTENDEAGGQDAGQEDDK
jgi:hypothetical protein